MIKTVELTGTEMKVEGLDGKNTAIYNKSSAAVYASCSPAVTPNADGVIEVPAGGYRGLNDTCGIIYLLGTGKVELTGTDGSVNFKMPSSSESGGGGGISGDSVCGTAEFVSGGIKSIPITVSGNKNEAFAAALAAETGWELQQDGVSVLNEGVGFRFISPGSYNSNGFVCLVNNKKNTDSLYLDYFQYLNNTGESYCMDVCKSANGTVAFGFRLKTESPNLSFVMTKDSNGDFVCMATYYNSPQLQLAKNDYTDTLKFENTNLRANCSEKSVIGLFRLLEDCYCVYLAGSTVREAIKPGKVVSVDGIRFAVVYNAVYSDGGQIWLAIRI